MHKRYTSLLILIAGCSQGAAPPVSLSSVGVSTSGNGTQVSTSGGGTGTSTSGTDPTTTVPPGMTYTSSPPTLTFPGEIVLANYGSQNVTSISINTRGYSTASISTDKNYNDISIGTGPGTYSGCTSPSPGYATFWDIQASQGTIMQWTCVPNAGYVIWQNTNESGATSYLSLANKAGASANLILTRDNATAACADGGTVVGPYALAPTGPCTVLDSGGSPTNTHYPLVIGTGGGTTAAVIQQNSQLFATGSKPLPWLKAVSSSGAITTTVGESTNGASVTNIVGPSPARTLVNGVQIAANHTGTTGPIGGSALAHGACSSGSVAVPDATNTMAVVATPATFPGAGYWWAGYVSSTGTVTVEICNSTGATGTPAASTYNVRVLQ